MNIILDVAKVAKLPLTDDFTMSECCLCCGKMFKENSNCIRNEENPAFIICEYCALQIKNYVMKHYL